ncbi:hypothetical protein [Dyella sp. 333MFSha]|uniref:hypothetical protein n=1 Tax=Dyella sp. 333MFSha TaxID=1798240 RepID=UPI0008836244|nr:hypothetical protein [Dyella sp. 333MFSha]SDG75400.1 hypothetical protein SAMN04515659_3431 [Dyella sp. 333MFSha]
MARKDNTSNWYWPTFGNRADAQQAMKGAAIASWFVAFVNLALGLFLLFSGPGAHALGLTGAAVIDGAVFALVGWRIWRYSMIAAFAGLGLFTLEKVYQFATQPKAVAGLIMAIIIWMAFLNGVRGAFALRDFARKAELPAPDSVAS